MKTRVPEIIACINCGHNIVAKLYEVDTTINSAQGHFHTVHDPAQAAYTVYCINCGHFITNDPHQSPQKPEPEAVGHAAKRVAARNRGATDSAARTSASKSAQRTESERAEKHKPTTASSRGTPHKNPVQTRAKGKLDTGSKKKSSPKKPSHSPRKKAK